MLRATIITHFRLDCRVADSRVLAASIIASITTENMKAEKEIRILRVGATPRFSGILQLLAKLIRIDYYSTNNPLKLVCIINNTI